MDLKCQDSICCSKDYCHIYKYSESLYLGQNYCYDYIIYLYFDLPSYSCLKYLKEARLILFKLPMEECNENQADSMEKISKYSILPLLEFFSTYSYKFCEPALDYNLRVDFEDTSCSYTEVDITSIVKAWVAEKEENKGIILMGNNDAQFIAFVNNYGMIGMRPRLRLIYDENGICPPLVSIPCTVEVDNTIL